MKVFSAAEAVSPTIDRTRRYLFQPFTWGTYLKLSAVACVTEGFSANFNMSLPQDSSSGTGSSTPFNLSSEMIALIVIGVLVCFASGIFIFYLVTRLRFVFFHCLVHKTKEIRPAWALYGAQAMRLFKSSLVIWFSVSAIVMLAALPFALAFFDFFKSVKSGEQFDAWRFILLFLPLLGIIFVVCLVVYAMDVVFHDFMLPHMALEGALFGEAWAAVRPRIETEKGSFFFYLFLRAILPFVAMMGVMVVAAIPFLIIFGIVALSTMGFHSLYEDATGVVAVIGAAFDVLLGFIGLCIGLVVAFSHGGPIATWIRNYALLFYGGRYTALGDILSPPLPPPPPSTILGTAEVG